MEKITGDTSSGKSDSEARSCGCHVNWYGSTVGVIGIGKLALSTATVEGPLWTGAFAPSVDAKGDSVGSV